MPNHGEEEHGYSLHHINLDYDAGHIIDIRRRKLDYSKPMLLNNEDTYPLGVNMILNAVNSVAHGEQLEGEPQDVQKKGYYSFPAKQDLKEYWQKGLRFINPTEMVSLYLEKYSHPGTEHYEGLRVVIDDAIGTFNRGFKI
jgi:methionyl-tRNA formyltransferase